MACDENGAHWLIPMPHSKHTHDMFLCLPRFSCQFLGIFCWKSYWKNTISVYIWWSRKHIYNIIRKAVQFSNFFMNITYINKPCSFPIFKPCARAYRLISMHKTSPPKLHWTQTKTTKCAVRGTLKWILLETDDSSWTGADDSSLAHEQGV